MNTFKVFVIAWSFASMPALSDIITFECDYPTYSDKTGVQESTGLEFKFVSDTATGKAYMSGSNGSTEVSLSMRSDKEGVNVLELTNSGNMMLTTILFSGQTVHSRNSVIMGEFIASQYYGICEIK
jgi:hypothetical protein